MGFASAGKKIGDVYENDGHKYRVTGIIEGVGYNVEIVNDEEELPWKDLPFAPNEEDEEPLPFPMDEEPKKRKAPGRKRTTAK